MVKVHQWLRFWPALFAADTSHLSDEEIGIYIRVLVALMLAPKQRLPAEVAWLARKFRKDEDWVRQRLYPIVIEFCARDGHWIRHAKVTQEVLRAQHASHIGAINVSVRWKKKKPDTTVIPIANAIRKKEKKEDSTFLGTDLFSESENPPPTSTEARASKKARAQHVAPEEIPDWVPKDEWSDFVAMRADTKHPLTPTARKRALNRLRDLIDDGCDAASVLNQSTRNGWRDLFPVRPDVTGGNGHERKLTTEELTDMAMKSFEAKYGKESKP
jgi:uncharacterized protein YdaU (DUF1376 family)